MFGVGPAGTGKTYLAMAQAVAFLVAKKVSRIILARPAVEAGEKLGFLPGDLQEKVNPYLRPLYDALYDMLDVERVARYIERGTIEIAPIAFMRGRTLNDSFVILDEAQNTTSEQMKMFLTRLGFGSKAVITGDITQIDLPTGRMSGLVEAIKRRERNRRDCVHPFRRARRRPAQAGAADRQGLRGVLESGAARCSPGGRAVDRSAARRCARRSGGRSASVAVMIDGDQRLSVSLCDAWGRPLSVAALGRWLEAAAPARARGVVSVALVSDARVRELNRRYRGRDYATDVLSFPSRERPFLGDIVIARGVARRQARSAGHSEATELRVLALHGLLHLLGYDHERDAAACAASKPVSGAGTVCQPD